MLLCELAFPDFERYELHVEAVTIVASEDGDTALLWTRVEVVGLKVVRFPRGKFGARLSAEFGVARSTNWAFGHSRDLALMPSPAVAELERWFQQHKLPLLRWLVQFPFARRGGSVEILQPHLPPPDRP